MPGMMPMPYPMMWGFPLYPPFPFSSPLAPIAPKELKKTDNSDRVKAAIVFQKYTRGHLVRKEYGDLKMNRMVQLRDPVKYWTEVIADELLRKEMIPDILVELSDESEYFPFAKTRAFKAYWLRYHLFEEAITNMTRECIRETIQDLSSRHLKRVTNGETLQVKHLFWQTVDDEIESVLEQVIDEITTGLVIQTKSSQLFDMLLQDVIQSEKLLEECLEELTIEWVWDWFVTAELEYTIGMASLDICKQLGRALYMRRPTLPQSVVLNRMMDKILEEMLISALVSSKESTSTGLLNEFMDDVFHEFVLNIMVPRRRNHE